MTTKLKLYFRRAKPTLDYVRNDSMVGKQALLNVGKDPDLKDLISRQRDVDRNPIRVLVNKYDRWAQATYNFSPEPPLPTLAIFCSSALHWITYK